MKRIEIASHPANSHEVAAALKAWPDYVPARHERFWGCGLSSAVFELSTFADGPDGDPKGTNEHHGAKYKWLPESALPRYRYELEPGDTGTEAWGLVGGEWKHVKITHMGDEAGRIVHVKCPVGWELVRHFQNHVATEFRPLSDPPTGHEEPAKAEEPKPGEDVCVVCLSSGPHKWTKIAPDGLPAVRFVCDECLKACADAVKEAEPVTARGMPTFKDRKEIEAVLKVIRVSGLTSLWDAIGLVAENYESKSTNKVRRWLDLIDQNEARIAELTDALAAIPAEGGRTDEH